MKQGLLAAGGVFVADQITKLWMLDLVFDPPRILTLTPFFNLTPVWNRGVSFGLLSSHQDWMPYILSAVALAISIGMLVWLRRATPGLLALALGLVIGGAIGNVIDRLRYGAVVDFLDFHISGYHWPAFNIADAAICVGVLLILWYELFQAKPARQTS
ncbi:signal peptidase II [Oceanibaculum pacificum]|uniref:Lipoprotein signal peptidase n=2 Tax=Oceanibaculum pacificum TaxID=580166 RepID=A0A154WF39_9PROT|nr:signal peptidase II [Oceanibaculum pacificum]